MGDVMINGEIVDRELLNNISGFVPQNDLAVESLTVQEHMEFMVKINNNNNRTIVYFIRIKRHE